MRYLQLMLLLFLGVMITGCSDTDEEETTVRERYYTLEEYHAYLECKSEGGSSTVPLNEDIFSSAPFDKVRLYLVDTTDNADCYPEDDPCPDGFTCNSNFRCEKSCAEDSCPSGYICSDELFCQKEADIKKLYLRRCTIDMMGQFQCELNPAYGFFWKNGYRYSVIDNQSASFDVGVGVCTLSRTTGQLQRYQKSMTEGEDDVKMSENEQLPDLSDESVIYKWEERHYDYSPRELDSNQCVVGLVDDTESEYNQYFPTYAEDSKGERCQRKETFKLVFFDPNAPEEVEPIEQPETEEDDAEDDI